MAERKFSHILLASTALTCVALTAPQQAVAGPEDGIVTGGSATITQSGLTTAIHQSSDRAIIDWRSFDVNANETVRFYQPGSSSITLNRINDSKASLINGRVEANGQIMLLNQNGVVFGSTSRVDVAGLVASTGRVDDAAFMGGATTIHISAGNNATAAIINHGTITAQDAGLVGLVGPNVENHGVIQAHLGKVTLAGTDHVTLDLAGDGLISVAVDNEFNGSVKNSGAIIADGGTITLTASRARNAVENSIVNTGTLRANSVSNRNGRIILSAGGNRAGNSGRGQSTIAAIKNAGTIKAASGKIEVLGDSIQLASTSTIDASGMNGDNGGTINIGGSYQGVSDRPTATWVEAEHGSMTRSDGDIDGDGGTIIFWADRLMSFRGTIEAEGGDESGDGGFVEVSGKNHLIFGGDVSTKALNGQDGTLLLDPTNITISSGADQNVSGSSPYTPTADDTTSVLNITTLLNALASGNVIVQTRATGAQAGDITVSSAITWTSGNTLTLDAHNNIIVNQAISANSGNLTLIAGNDVQLNANLTGTGTLTLMPGADNVTVGVGASAVGTFNISTTDYTRLVNGWNLITLGRTTSTAAMDLRATTWTDNLTVQSGTGTITVNGIQNMGANTLSIATDGDIALAITGALTGTGALFVSQVSAGTTIGLGDSQAGTIQFTNTEVGRIANGWASLTFGRTDGTGVINVGALTFNDVLTLQSGTGVINVNGVMTMGGNNLTLRTDADVALGVANALTGTGALTIVQSSNGTSIGLGDSQAGTINFTTAEVARMTSTWGSITIGRTDGTADINLGALSWLDPLVLQTGTGTINFNGTQTMAANNLTVRTDSTPYIDAAATLSGTGTFALVQASANTSMGIGTGEAGTIQIDTVELSRIMGTWGSLVFGRTDGTGAMNVAGGLTMLDPTTFRTGSGQLNINGNLTMGANGLTLQTDSDLYVGGNLSGSGTNIYLSIAVSNAATSIGVGDGQAGTLSLSNAELARFANGWSAIYIGTTTQTGALNVASRSWVDPLILRTASGQLTVEGATMAANNLTISTDSNLAITGALTGTGTLTIQPTTVSTSIGVGNGQAGTLNLTDAELDLITNGWTTIVIGTTSITGAMNVGARTWNDNLTLRTSTGIMTINGNQNMGANNLTLTTASNILINANLIGTGVLSITGASNSTTIGVGTGQTGTLQLSDTELNYINDGWSSIVIGSTAMTGAMNVGARTWLDSLDLRTNSGALNINGAINMGANNLVLRTNTNLALGYLLAGTGNLTILGSSGATSMGIGNGQTGTLNLTDTELGFISDGWTNIVFGSTGMTGAMNVGARTWTDNVIMRTSSGIMTVAAQTMGSNNLTLQSNVDMNLTGNMTGTGTLTIANSTAGTTITIGIGTGATGTLQLSDTELGYLVDGWSSIIIGATTQTGAMNVNARTWNDNLTLITGSGLMTIAGNQTMGANNLTLQTDSSLALNGNLTGTGQLTIQSSAAGTTIGVGTGQTGTLALADTELARIIDGWAGITIGNATGTGVINVAARTWTDNLTLRSGTGVMTIAGIQTMGANNLTLQTDSNLALNANLVGTGALRIQGGSLATTMGIGDTQTGTLNLTNTELGRLVDGWSSVTLGRSDSFGNMNIGAYTWVNPMTFITGGNVIVNGVQNSTETSGTSLVYATINGAFINNTGASALNAGGGRYLVYSVAETNDTLGGLVRPTILTSRTYAGYGPSSVTETGNVYLYSGIVDKILYLTIDNAQKTYGSASPTFTFTYVGGLQNGDALNDAITSYTLSALGATVLDDAGTNRTITGSFNTALGYSVSVTNGTMTVIKADLVAEVDDDSRAYGDANGTFTFTYSGFRNGDDETDLDTAPTAATTATILSNVGSYAITGSGGLDNNYNIVITNGNLTINKSTLTATVQSATKVYGDANPGFNIVYTGFKNSETSAVIDTLGTVSTAATALSNVGTYTLTGSGAVDNNYSFAYTNSNMTITKAVLTATANDASKTYGDANPALGVTYTGFRNGDTASVIDTAATASTTATALTSAGTATITASGGVDNNYSFTYVNGTLTINKATLTATANNQSREYGLANPALTVSYSGFRNGDTAAVIDTSATAATTATAASNVGNYTITVSGGVDNNYDFTYVNGSLGITKAMLTATANNQSREYGDTNPALTVSYTGFRNGDTASVIDTAATGATSATALSNVGNYTITASGATDNNYDFTYVNGTLGVTKAMLTATANNQSRVYGDNNPTLTTSYTGFKNGETASVIDTAATATSATSSTTGVGTYAIATAGATDNNYDFTYVNGTLTITKAMVTVTANNQTREYGLANPTLSVTYTGLKNSEAYTVIDTLATAATGATILSNVGNYAITASGANDDNYDFTYVGGTLDITKAMLTATADSQTRIYGDANPALTVSYTGFRNGDTATVIDTAATATTTATVTSNVGSYGITASGAVDNNYNFSYVGGNLAITKATLAVTANDQSRIYGDSNPVLTASYSGFRNGDTASALDAAPVIVTAATSASDVGTYAITASGGLDNNYTYTYTPGTLTITKADLTITADNQSRAYGDANPTLTMSYSGFRNGDTSSVLNGQPTIGTTANLLSNTGTYAITLSGGTDNNYNYILNNGTLTVNKSVLTVTADNQTRIYGDANPTLSAVYSGLKNGDVVSDIDTLATLSTSASTTSDVGSYAIAAAGGLDANYSFAYVNGALTITPATLTVTINNVTREYGLSNPTFTATYSGFRNGDTTSVLNVDPTFTTTAVANSNIGTYAITASGGSDNNYSLSFVNGNLTITPAALTIQADNQIRLYGEANPPLTYTASGLRAGDTTSVISGLIVSTTATPSSVLGQYSITTTGGSAANYTITHMGGTLDIVGTMPLPPSPVASLPPAASAPLNTSPNTTVSYNQNYGINVPYVFVTNTSAPGQELVEGTATTKDGYITIYYSHDVRGTKIVIPMISIAPELYYIYDDEYANEHAGL